MKLYGLMFLIQKYCYACKGSLSLYVQRRVLQITIYSFTYSVSVSFCVIQLLHFHPAKASCHNDIENVICMVSCYARGTNNSYAGPPAYMLSAMVCTFIVSGRTLAIIMDYREYTRNNCNTYITSIWSRTRHGLLFITLISRWFVPIGLTCHLSCFHLMLAHTSIHYMITMQYYILWRFG